MAGSWPARVALAAVVVASIACGGSPPPVTIPVTARTGPLGDTWTWDGGSWSRPTGLGPSARFDGAMAYDQASHLTILFGGSVLLDQFDDTWAWDGVRWSQLKPAHHPIALSGHAMAYDEARLQVVLYAGLHGLGEKAGPLTETWTWDGGDWTLRSREGPPTRERPAFAFDPARGEILLFGGSRGNTSYRNDTWAWDGQRWSEVPSTTRPSPRYGAAFAYDPAQRGLVLFGGAELDPHAGLGAAGKALADTWLEGSGGWIPASAATSPPASTGAALAYDPVSRRMIMFSGATCPFSNDTWAWDGANWSSCTRLLRRPPARARWRPPISGRSAWFSSGASPTLPVSEGSERDLAT